MANRYALSGGVELPINSNLNDYITVGNYYCSLSNITNTFSNCPIREAFTMKVEYSTGIGFVCQTVRSYSSGVQYYRILTNGWTQWVGVGSVLDPGFVISGKIVVVNTNKPVNGPLNPNDAILQGLPVPILNYPTLNFFIPSIGYAGQVYVDNYGNIKAIDQISQEGELYPIVTGSYILK